MKAVFKPEFSPKFPSHRLGNAAGRLGLLLYYSRLRVTRVKQVL